MTLRTSGFGLGLVALIALAAAPVAGQDIDPETGEVILPPDDQDPNEGTGVQSGQQQQPQQQQQQQTGGQPWYQGGATGQQQQQVERPPAVVADSEVPPGQQGRAQTTTPATSSGAASDSGQSDHMRVVHNLGVGFVGVLQVPIGPDAMGNTAVSAPTIGVRYWIDETIGLDVGIGLGYQGGNSNTGTTSLPQDDAFAMTIHGGLPVALFHDGHFTFELIPEINFGFATGTAYGAVSTEDRGRSGLLFTIGARAGAELQFGFMGIPNLSLMATVGLQFQYLSAGLGENQSGTVQGTTTNSFGFGTSLQGEPWDIFLGSLTAFYYFG